MDFADLCDTDPYLDKCKPIKTWWNKLPHWEQEKKIQFITFRLNDSLPQNLIERLLRIKNNFITIHPLPWNEKVKNLFYKNFSAKYEEYLNAGYGCCAFRNPDIRKILDDVLRFYDNRKYELLRYVIMPNHVHCLVHLLKNYEVSVIFQSIKRFTAKEIKNKHNLDIGFSKNWDRIIRDQGHLNSCIEYINNNPLILKGNEFTLGGMLK